MRFRPSAYNQGIEARAATSVRAGCLGSQGSQMIGATLLTGHADLGINPITVTLDDSMDWRGRMITVFAGLDCNNGATPFKSVGVDISPPRYDIRPIDGYNCGFSFGQFFYSGAGWNETGFPTRYMALREAVGTGDSYTYATDFIFFVNAVTGVLRFSQRRTFTPVPSGPPNVGLTYMLLASEQQGLAVSYP